LFPLVGGESIAAHNIEGLVSLAVPSAFNYKAVDFVWRYVVKPGTNGPKMPFLNNPKEKVIKWGTASQSEADGIIAAVRVSGYQNIQKHFATTHGFFDDGCKVWAGNMKRPVYVLAWIIERSSRENHRDGVIEVDGWQVFQFFLSFSDIGLPEFDD
jgi:hypothetical protein